MKVKDLDYEDLFIISLSDPEENKTLYRLTEFEYENPTEGEPTKAFAVAIAHQVKLSPPLLGRIWVFEHKNPDEDWDSIPLEKEVLRVKLEVVLI